MYFIDGASPLARSLFIFIGVHSAYECSLIVHKVLENMVVLVIHRVLGFLLIFLRLTAFSNDF